MQDKNRYISLLRRIYSLQKRFNFKMVKTGEIFLDIRYPLFKIEFGRGNKKALVFAGIHGDEPAGPEAILTLIQHMYKNKKLSNNFSFTIFPCDNPYGYAKNTRENSAGIDLNREFKNPHPPDEITFIKKGLGKSYFDIAFGLHEDKDSTGFYLYEPPTEMLTLGNKIIQAIKKAGFPVEENYSDNNSSMAVGNAVQIKNGIVVFSERKYFERSIDTMEQWPAAVYLIRNHTRKEFTFETPLNIALTERVKMHLLAIETSLNLL